jgi:hypothetical protein
MSFSALKQLLPNKPVPLRVLRGPFRGARVRMNPRHSFRKFIGVYEHELNMWLELALQRVTRVLDVGANDGYFTFGCAAAFRRLGKKGEIIAFEPQETQARLLSEGAAAQQSEGLRIEILQQLVGKEFCDGVTTLDALPFADRTHTLVKIDVEGSEPDVIQGARSWINSTNLFLIEVHRQNLLEALRREFREKGHDLILQRPRRLRFIGGETRHQQNWWLVSDLQRFDNSRQE